MVTTRQLAALGQLLGYYKGIVDSDGERRRGLDTNAEHELMTWFRELRDGTAQQTPVQQAPAVYSAGVNAVLVALADMLDALEKLDAAKLGAPAVKSLAKDYMTFASVQIKEALL